MENEKKIGEHLVKSGIITREELKEIEGLPDEREEEKNAKGN